MIRRGNAYLAAGALMVFVEGATSLEAIAAAVKAIRRPGRRQHRAGRQVGRPRPRRPGARGGRPREPCLAWHLQAATKAVADVFAAIRATGGVAAVADRLYGFRDLHELVGMGTVARLEETYLAPLKALLPEAAR